MSLDDVKHIDFKHLETTPRYIQIGFMLVFIGILLIIAGFLL